MIGELSEDGFIASHWFHIVDALSRFLNFFARLLKLFLDWKKCSVWIFSDTGMAKVSPSDAASIQARKSAWLNGTKKPTLSGPSPNTDWLNTTSCSLSSKQWRTLRTADLRSLKEPRARAMSFPTQSLSKELSPRKKLLTSSSAFSIAAAGSAAKSKYSWSSRFATWVHASRIQPNTVWMPNSAFHASLSNSTATFSFWITAAFH